MDIRFVSTSFVACPSPHDRLNPVSQAGACLGSIGVADIGPILAVRALLGETPSRSGGNGAVLGVTGFDSDDDAPLNEPVVDAEDIAVDSFLGRLNNCPPLEFRNKPDLNS